MSVGQFEVVSKAEPTPGQSLGKVAFFDEHGDPVDVGGGGATTVAWADVTGKPATFPPTVGTTATTAKAGNYTPTSTEVGNALKAKTQVAALASITAADATDEATAIALANATKATVNAIIAALKA